MRLTFASILLTAWQACFHFSTAKLPASSVGESLATETHQGVQDFFETPLSPNVLHQRATVTAINYFKSLKRGP